MALRKCWEYLRSMYKEANSLDKMPKKSIRKWKKKSRQKAKKDIRKQLNDN